MCWRYTLPMNNRSILFLLLFLLLFSFLLLAWLQQFTGLDFAIENLYFDPISHTFPWKNSWFAKDLMHGYLKNVLVMLGTAILLLCAIDYFCPIKKISPILSVRLRFIALSAIMIPALIAALKSQSSSHCPWDIEQYGGNYPHLTLFESLPSALKAGHCLPAGHASTGLWLAAFCVFWLPNAPRKAFLVFVFGLSVGFVMGWVQQMRGAHFISHTLWSMWLASLVIFCLLILFWPALQTKQ